MRTVTVLWCIGAVPTEQLFVFVPAQSGDDQHAPWYKVAKAPSIQSESVARSRALPLRPRIAGGAEQWRGNDGRPWVLMACVSVAAACCFRGTLPSRKRSGSKVSRTSRSRTITAELAGVPNFGWFVKPQAKNAPAALAELGATVLSVASALLVACHHPSSALAAEAPPALPSIKMPSSSERMATFQEASVDFADSLIPIVRSLKAKEVAPLASKSVALAATGDPKQIIQTIDAGLDAFLSVPPERFFEAVRALKEGTAEAATAVDCNLFCLPSPPKTQAVARVAADALSQADPEKLKTFIFRGGMSLASGEKQQYAGVLTEAVKFSFSLDKRDLGKVKDSGTSLLLSIDNAQPAKASKALPATKAYPKNQKLEGAALELADALYPVVGNLKASAVAPLASKVVSVGATGDPKEIMKTIDAGLDAFLSVPPERFFVAARALKEATAAAMTATDCNLVCMPPLATVEKVAGVASNALAVTDPARLEVFLLQAVASFYSGNKQQLASTLAEIKKFESTVSPSDLARVKVAAVDLLTAAGVTDTAVLGLLA